MAAGRSSPRRGIKDVFYETRVLMGRNYTLRRVATEMPGVAPSIAVDPCAPLPSSRTIWKSDDSFAMRASK